MRELRVAKIDSLAAAAKAAACPDCDSEVQVSRQPNGVYAATVAHDETCPALKVMGG
jgi:hypothetical protein